MSDPPVLTRTPGELYGDLFEQVQLGQVFEDSKTFVDAVPKRDPALIIADFEQARAAPAFDLAAFVGDNFDWQPPANAITGSGDRPPIREHIERLWQLLQREPGGTNRYSSLIALPKRYIVPGGRFNEIFYWDSYFTMLGLAAAGKHGLIADMVDNFAFLIDEIGFIPNGNRSYFCTRSQPPFFAMMVELLADIEGDVDALVRYLPHLEREYAFWMAGAETLDAGRAAHRRVVRLGDTILNRYWDESDAPRQESYAEDIQLSASTRRDPGELFRDIRAACESGCDFSSRWLAEAQALATVRTTSILPVDLNALMCRLETVLARANGLAGDDARAAVFESAAAARKAVLRQLFFDDEAGFFADLVLPDAAASPTLSLAGAFPLYLHIATEDQAARVARRLKKEFLQPGGWVTTRSHSGQQWDAPNGWAPLQWAVYTGLMQYGYGDDAEEGARRWVESNLAVYGHTGYLMEKYDVEHPGVPATGGEYSVQNGFGWTNGILLRFLDALDM